MEKTLKSERLDEIFRRVGAALWILQKLESQAAIYFLLRVSAKKGMGLEKGTEALIKQNKKTFGTTFRALEDSEVLPQDLKIKLKSILSERNWLAHESSVQGYIAIDSEVGTRDFFERIESIKSEALSLMRSLTKLSESHVKKIGITQEEIDSGMKIALQLWFESEII